MITWSVQHAHPLCIPLRVQWPVIYDISCFSKRNKVSGCFLPSAFSCHSLFLLLQGGAGERRYLWEQRVSDAPGAFPSRYDDYDYGEVNQLLERNLKVYIKTVACYPEKTTRRMYNHFWRHFRHSEKVRLLGEEQDGSRQPGPWRRQGVGTQ